MEAGLEWPSQIQDSLFPELDETLVLKYVFQNLWRSKKKAAIVSSPIKEAFERLVEQHRLYEILKVERWPAEVRLTLANLWRLTRVKGRRSLILHTFDLRQGHWREEDPEAIAWHKRDGLSLGANWPEGSWPDLEIRCLKAPARPGLFKKLLGGLLGKIIIALQASLPGSRYEWHVFADYVSRRFDSEACRRPASIIHSALHRHILDPELLSLLLPIRRHQDGRISISLYLAAQPHRDDLARINRETPNLPPLLNFIPPKTWARPDLWQDQVLRASGPIFQQMSARGLRWLRRAPAETLGYFHHFFMTNGKENDLLSTAGELADIMAGLPPQATNQSEATGLLIGQVWNFLLRLHQPGAHREPLLAARLARLLARHISSVLVSMRLGSSGLAPSRLRSALRDDFGIYHLIDWFLAEGKAQGLPDKNSTWESLKRHSDQWHEDVWQMRPVRRKFGYWLHANAGLLEAEEALGLIDGREERPVARASEEEENAAWESLLGPMEISGIKIKPLVTSLDLCNEGRELRHCLSSYTRRCLENGCRIFSLTEPDGKRSTLSLIQSYSGSFSIDQHKGPCNGPVSPAATKAAFEICRLYTLKYLETAEAAPGSTIAA
jgi:hypothetical protein